MTLEKIVIRTLAVQKRPLSPQQIHELLPTHLDVGKHNTTVEDVEAVLIGLDQAGHVRNDLVPVSSITEEGLIAAGYKTR